MFVGGAFDGVEDTISPFGYKRGEGIDAGYGEPQWIVSKEKPRYDEIFSRLSPTDGKVTGACKYKCKLSKIHRLITVFHLQLPSLRW